MSQMSQSQLPDTSPADQVSQLSLSQPEDFPLGYLPPRVLFFVFEAAHALDVDYSMVAGPCLATLAGCIGNRRRIIVKPSWCEPSILWVAVVSPSGSKKTPAMGLVLRHLQTNEASEWVIPGGVVPARLLVSDITSEALLSVHANAPLGLLLYRDELGGWISGFNQYKGSKGSDAQTWTEVHDGNPCLIDRKGAETLRVPRAAVSIVGGIQPKVLRKTLSDEQHLDNGVASRLLFVVPAERPNVWNEDTVKTETLEGWACLLDELLALKANEDGTPFDLPMATPAKEAWISYYTEHGQRQHAEDYDPMKSAMSKLAGATARLALIIQLATDPQSVAVDIEAMKAGITLSNWFEGQARRVYRSFVETAEERDRREACEWIARQGGRTTKRDFSRLGPLRFRKRADDILAGLVGAGLANQTPKSGHHGEEYILCSPGNETPQDFD